MAFDGALPAQDTIAQEILQGYSRAYSARSNWQEHWEEIAWRVWPDYAGSFTRQDLYLTQGQKRTQEMVDPTAALALPKFAAAMESMLTPRNSTWHRLRAMDKTLQRNRSVSLWFDEVNQKLFDYRYATRANYASQQHQCYLGLGAFGTASLFIDKLDKRYGGGLSYRAIHLAEIYFLDNHQGIIDKAYRRFQLTTRQIAQQFNRATDMLPDEIKSAIDDPAKQDEHWWIVHCVQPRTEAMGYDPERADVKGMEFAAHYVSETGKCVIREGGHNTFPYPVSRYVVAPGETYGRSPAMLALPTIKTLNEMKKTMLKAGHRAVDPVILAHDDGVMDGFQMRAGAINSGAVTADGKLLVHALQTGNFQVADKMMEAERAAINDALLVTLFQILIETPQMTATEVLERAREKGALLSPTMGRQQSEALGPMIDRELDLLTQQRLLPPMPLILKQAGAEYDTMYDSPLSRAQRAEAATGFLQWVNWARDIVSVTQDPSVLDYANWDVAMPALADIQAVPTAWTNDPTVIANIRQQRAQKQQTQQALDAAPGLAGAAKALPQAKLNLSGTA